jgi:hypothetical protein
VVDIRARSAWAYATIVIAGLDPAIHLLEWSLLFDGCAGIRAFTPVFAGYARA